LDITQLKRYLTQYVERFTETRSLCLYIDALDESGEGTARDLVDYFTKLLDIPAPRFKIYVSCRPWPKAISKQNHDYRITIENKNREDTKSPLGKNLNKRRLSRELKQNDPEETRRNQNK